MRNFFIFLVGVVFFVGSSAYGGGAEKTYARIDHVIKINAKNASIGDKPAVGLMLGGDENHIVEVWLPKSGFSKNGYEDSALSNSKIMATGWGERSKMLFDTPKTLISKTVKIVSVDYKAKTAVLSLAFDLAEENLHLVLEKTDIPIAGEQFKAIFPSRK